MENKVFTFSGSIQGDTKVLNVVVPVENNGVYTHKYCPQELITGGIDSVVALNGEIISDFVADCRKQVMAMEAAGIFDSRLDAHIAGLVAVVMDHLGQCGRLIFGDLLIYMDVFSLLLEADGFSEEEIKEIYPRITRTIVELYYDYILNTTDLSPFKGCNFDLILSNL